MCNRNRDIRKRQIIPHNGHVMSLSRRRNNLKIEIGKNIGRAEMWKITHKRKNGTYVNDEALEIGEKIDELMLTNPSICLTLCLHILLQEKIFQNILLQGQLIWFMHPPMRHQIMEVVFHHLIK
ncbi:uncharacterized protein [Phaseolus vulgaris]|uniref:uncharacterized protein n=1 Tax=Phaseolus vulgaris TaxID=3885 RepID=UPI0035CA7B66